MPVERIGGVNLHWQTLGTAGPHVVLLHGLFLGSLTTWYFSAGPALAIRRRVHMYDLRGHGRSERTPSGYGVRQLAADLQALLGRVVPGERISLVGHSYGAVIALRYALDHPSAVDRLVLVEPPLPVATLLELDAIRDDLYRGFVNTLTPWQRLLVRVNRRQAGQTIIARAKANETRDRLLGMLPEVKRKTLESGGRRAERLFGQMDALVSKTTIKQDLLDDPDIQDAELAGYDGRVLLVCGTRTLDPLRKTGARLRRTLPNARLEWLDGTHALPWESPRPLAALIGKFLDD